ncbi:MAG: GNAT family N-acetyltransferase [Muribaculaceae bacterium]|nr:GNAT family N-acetyltransferase [Muribaculaceae bacterium]
MNDYIFPTLTNNRLTLREYNIDDIDAYFNLMSNPIAIRYYREPIKHITDVTIEFDSDKIRRKNNESIRWAITLSSQNEFIGTIDLYNINLIKKIATLGCAVSPNYQHKSIGHESIMLVIKYAFEKLKINRIQLFVNPENAQAIRTYKRIGFIQEGLLREYEFNGNTHCDMFIFSILKKDFDQ